MGDERVSVAEMGNQQGHGAKKKKKHAVISNSNGNGDGELSEEDSDYKYVSIVDVSSPPASTFSERIHVDSAPVLKCSVMIGEKEDKPLESSCVSRVSVNGSTELLGVFTNGSMEQLKVSTNGSTELLEVSTKGSMEQLGISTNGSTEQLGISTNGSSHSSMDCSEEVSFAGHIPDSASQESGHTLEQLSPEDLETDRPAVVNGFSDKLNASGDDPEVEALNGMLMDVEEATPSLEERLAEAVRQTLDGQHDVAEDIQEEVERAVREKLKRQRSGSSDHWAHEEQDDHCIVDFLDKINDHAEARLAAKRQARAEAREIRMRELERMQKETDDGDKVHDVYSTPVEAINRCVRAGSVTTMQPRSLLSSNNSYHSSRRSSEDSLEDGNSIRDIRLELKELEEKFRKAMIANAQLDNEKAAFSYQVDLFKDRYEELEEQNLQLQREHKETSRQLEQSKRHCNQLQENLDISQAQLTELSQLVQEKGLVVVEGDGSSSEEESEDSHKKTPKKALVSADVADVLQQGTGSLDVRLKKFVEERNELLDELRRVKMELEEERAHSRGRHHNGPTGDSEDIQREANKLLGDYKFKLQKAEQDVNTLQANVARLESQVIRYRSAAETSEKLEVELKLEKRKLQRELREALARIEELETSHSHLQKRMDKLKNAKSALLKDL